MTALIVFLAVLLAAGLAAGAYALFAPAKTPAVEPAPGRPAADPAPGWADAAGAEFDTLSESARCDFIFALGALPDDRARGILMRALDDRSEAVALAAAHVLLRSDGIDAVRQHVASQDPVRRAALMQLLSVMT